MTTALQAQIKETIRRITAARQQVADNQPVDMQGLDDNIEQICIAARDERHRGDINFRTALETMLNDLDLLETDLTRQRDLMSGQPDRTVAPGVAASAYGKPKR